MHKVAEWQPETFLRRAKEYTIVVRLVAEAGELRFAGKLV